MFETPETLDHSSKLRIMLNATAACSCDKNYVGESVRNVALINLNGKC